MLWKYDKGKREDVIVKYRTNENQRSTQAVATRHLTAAGHRSTDRSDRLVNNQLQVCNHSPSLPPTSQTSEVDVSFKENVIPSTFSSKTVSSCEARLALQMAASLLMVKGNERQFPPLNLFVFTRTFCSSLPPPPLNKVNLQLMQTLTRAPPRK